MQAAWLVVAIASTFGYHLVIKLTPGTVNPLLSLAVTYATVTLLFAAAAVLLPGELPLRDSLRELNWTAPVLAATIVGLDLGFLLLYRGGFELSLAQIVTQSAGRPPADRRRGRRVPRASHGSQRRRHRVVHRGPVADQQALTMAGDPCLPLQDDLAAAGRERLARFVEAGGDAALLPRRRWSRSSPAASSSRTAHNASPG